MTPWVAADRQSRAARGSILLEVLVAIVILGVFLAGLSRAFQVSYQAAVELRTQRGALPTSLVEDTGEEAWSWGPMLDSVEWDAGPELCLVPGIGCDDEVEVGIWIDGWLLGEWGFDACGGLRLGPSTWDDMTGQEVVVRARRAQGGWGAPWRSVVPDAYGASIGTTTHVGVELEPATGFLEANVVMHLRGLAIPGVQASWSTSAVADVVEGVVLIPGDTCSGVCTLVSDSRIQSWVNDEDRQVDVYW